jgi:hypothetical protein
MALTYGDCQTLHKINSNKYPDYKDKEKIEREFNELIKNGVIAKPKLENSTTLYFFKRHIKDRND